MCKSQTVIGIARKGKGKREAANFPDASSLALYNNSDIGNPTQDTYQLRNVSFYNRKRLEDSPKRVTADLFLLQGQNSEELEEFIITKQYIHVKHSVLLYDKRQFLLNLIHAKHGNYVQDYLWSSYSIHTQYSNRLHCNKPTK